MPDFTLDDALAEAYASAPAAEDILHTLEIRHPSFTEPIRVVRDFSDITAKLESSAPLNPGEFVSFVKMSFYMTVPNVEKATSPEFEVGLDSASAEITGYMDAASQSPDLIEMTYRPYLASDISTPTMNPPLTMVVRAVNVGIFRAVAKAGYGDFANRKFPGETITTMRFPGLGS